jgi:hypothetical protein
MKSAYAGFAAGLAGLLLMLELLCRVLPVSTATMSGYHVDADILNYAPRHEWRFATGWDLRNPQVLHSNSHGYIAEREFVRNEQAIALIGDSYVEAASLDAADRPAPQLEQALGGQRPVYAMGGAGTALLDYAERIRFAHEQFGVRDFVLVVERGDPIQSLCGSGNVASPCLDPQTLDPRRERVPPPGLAKRVLRHSALAQYMAGQLKLDLKAILLQTFTRNTPHEAVAAAPKAPAGEADFRAIDRVTDEFFSRIKPYATGRLVMVVDADRRALMNGRYVEDPRRLRFMERARAAGATVVDTEPLYRAHFEKSRLSLELSPQDGHFNPVTVRMVSGAAADALQREP